MEYQLDITVASFLNLQSFNTGIIGLTAVPYLTTDLHGETVGRCGVPLPKTILSVAEEASYMQGEPHTHVKSN